MCEREKTVWYVIFFLLGASIFMAAYFAPCGCYEGVPVKDVPLRCFDKTENGR